MSKARFMVDIEGLGEMPYGVILSIGWCRFTPDGPMLEESGEVRLEIQPQLEAGLTVDEGPINFWLAQTALPWAPDTPPLHPRTALRDFCVAMFRAAEIWAKPPQYDLVGIQAALKAFDLVCPWHFRAERCFRTLSQTAPPELRLPQLPEGTKHGALADAVHQAREAAAMLKAMSR
ncbi:MAG: 3'-5' exoribonuclease [Gammaproteobacteria bacterium]|nr:3'-5' exoribonuclease [Gammaproteobacteria bacterium]